ncbi:MAG: hypothetical protein IJJ23_12450, partial [Clostridia bacterium]|nr:hypothetical protein [Clostridia bacterium]
MCENFPSPEGLRALRYYQGDVEGDDPFWGDPRAYVTLNALFLPGLMAEKERVREGKRLNPEILADGHRLSRLIEDLTGLCRPLPAPMQTRRVERLAEFALIRDSGRLYGFTSTSKRGFLPSYADKRGVALLVFRLPAGTPCVDLSAVLPHYLKADEAEVLLPPGLSV